MSLDLTGFLIPWLLTPAILAIHAVAPGRWVDGYVKDARGEPLRYHLNGATVLDVVLVLYLMLCGGGWLAWDGLWLHRWGSLFGAVVLGLLFSAAFVLPYPSTGRPFWEDFYLGRVENAQLDGGRVDAKMWLYLVGAVTLQLHAVSYAAHHALVFGADGNPGVYVAAAMLTWFVRDYLTFEEIHLYTYDLFAERVGFKLGWGCLAFYPYFYAIGLWTTVDRPDPGTSRLWIAACVALFFAGWVLSRGSNVQKFRFKQDPTAPVLGLYPESITDGERRLLVNGFWGLSRHVNYLGETAMALAIALVLGHPAVLGPWLYPLYYVALFIPRQRDDDARCAAKYGPLWTEYVRRVPWRIVPGLY